MSESWPEAYGVDWPEQPPDENEQLRWCIGEIERLSLLLRITEEALVERNARLGLIERLTRGKSVTFPELAS